MNNNKREEITNLIEQTIKDFMDYSKISKTSLARIIYAALSADGYLREVTKQQEPEKIPKAMMESPWRFHCEACSATSVDGVNWCINPDAILRCREGKHMVIDTVEPTNPTEAIGYAQNPINPEPSQVFAGSLEEFNQRYNEPTTKETMETKGSKLMTYDDTWALIDERSAKHLEDLMRDGYIQRTPKQPEQSQLEELEEWIIEGMEARWIDDTEHNRGCKSAFKAILDKIKELKK